MPTSPKIETEASGDQSSPPARGRARPIFAIFEGGGAKGVAHVGALQAAQDNGLEIVGVAGASAGALVAVMVAIGLEAGDIMSADDRDDHILARLGTTPTALLGLSEWAAFERLLRHGRRAAYTGAAVGAMLNFLLAPRIMLTVARGVRRLGHFSSDTIRIFINQVIRDRLTVIAREAGLDWDVPDQVTFADLARGWPTVIPLKIVATDVDRGRLEIFEAGVTPQVVVAEAAAASIAIPLLFRPAAIPSFRPGRFADGELVANLPVWTFAEEKLGYEREHPGDPPVPIVGFDLGIAAATGEDQIDVRGGVIAYAQALASAALQGSQATASRFLDDVSIVPVDATLGLLDFEASWEAYRDAREAGRRSAARHFRFMLSVKPDRVRRELSSIRDSALRAIDEQRRRRGALAVRQLRVGLIRPYGQASLRVVESLGMDADADDRLILDRRGPGAAEAFRSRGLRVLRLDDPVRDVSFMTKYERALLRPTVAAALYIPIFADPEAWALDEAERPEPAGILTLDSDTPLAADFQDDDLVSLLVTMSAVLYEAVGSEVNIG